MKCGICGNDFNNTEIEALEMMYGTREKFKYFQCASCGCLQITEPPVDIAKYYRGHYYSLSTAVPNFAEKEKAKHVVLRDSPVIGRILAFYKPDQALQALSRVPLTKKSSILDVGCGAGRLLNSLRDIGFENVLGIDPFIEKDIEYQNGLKILKKPVLEIVSKWDVVLLSHSFEHMWEQHETLKKISELLNPAGVCIIRIPLADSLSFRRYGANWCGIDAPRHFYLHTVKSINLSAEKAGLKINGFTYDSYEFQFLGSEKYKKGRTLDSITTDNVVVKLLRYPKKLYYRWKASVLNRKKLGDQAAFYLVKK